MERMNERSNVVTWIEIPVVDMDRAQKFYEAVFDIKMRRISPPGEEMALFPSVPNVIQATSGRVSGCLLKSSRAVPSNDGILIYLNAYPEIQIVIDKVLEYGGTILVQKTKQFYGFYCVFVDTEGNRLALHSEA